MVCMGKGMYSEMLYIGVIIILRPRPEMTAQFLATPYG